MDSVRTTIISLCAQSHKKSNMKADEGAVKGFPLRDSVWYLYVSAQRSHIPTPEKQPSDFTRSVGNGYVQKVCLN